MKNLSQNLIKVFFLTLLTLTSLSAQELTKSSVEDMIEQMDRAASNMDVVGISKSLHPDVSITINVNISGQKQVIKPTKKEYVQLLTQGFQAVKHYTHEISNIDIQIEGGKAYVSMDITETYETNNVKEKGQSKESFVVESFNGKLLVSKVVAFTQI